LFESKAPDSDRTNQLQRVDTTWLESTITWNNQPTVTGATVNAQTGTTDSALIRWSVDADVQGFLNGTLTNFGWRVIDSSELGGSGNRTAQYRSTEANSATDKTPGPVLLIDY